MLPSHEFEPSSRVTSPVLESLWEKLAGAPGFRRERGRPHVTLAYAQSLDGSIAAVPGRPLPLSCPSTMELTHELRANHDGILIGIGTALSDNPRLTVRLVPGESPRPIVVDSALRLPADSNLLRSARRRVCVATTEAADPDAARRLEEQGADIARLPSLDNGWVDMESLLRYLSETHGMSRLLVEGGSRILTSLLHARLADYAVVTVSPRFVGGVSALSRNTLPSFTHLHGWQSERVGEDLVLAGELRFA